jgi:predicted membrane-bound mannosyltransferase
MDHYFKFENKKIHYIQLILSFGLVVVLGGIIGFILIRKLDLDMTNIQNEHVKRRNFR